MPLGTTLPPSEESTSKPWIHLRRDADKHSKLAAVQIEQGLGSTAPGNERVSGLGLSRARIHAQRKPNLSHASTRGAKGIVGIER